MGVGMLLSGGRYFKRIWSRQIGLFYDESVVWQNEKGVDMGGIFSRPKAPVQQGPSQAELDAIARREKLAEEDKARQSLSLIHI